MIENERGYIDGEVAVLIGSLCQLGLSIDTINQSLLNYATWGLAHGADAERPAQLRQIADEMDAGRYRTATEEPRQKPILSVIQGGRT